MAKIVKCMTCGENCKPMTRNAGTDKAFQENRCPKCHPCSACGSDMKIDPKLGKICSKCPPTSKKKQPKPKLVKSRR